MAWYRSGTLSVTNGSTSVTGAGTSWIAGAGIGEALYAPDGRIYEIANISSNTSLTLATAYLGTTQSAQSYTIIPSQSYIRDLAADAAALISQYAGIASGAGAGKFTDGTVSTPGIAFASDVDTGIYHPATNTLGIAAGGINQMQVSTAGVNIGTLSANPVISAGTANGVTYLNASKQLTSGSALTFDGTNLGVGTGSPAERLSLQGVAYRTAIQLNAATEPTGYGARIVNDTSAGSTSLQFHINNFYSGYQERARIDSHGNFLVGANSVFSAVGGYKTIQISGAGGGIVDIGNTSAVFGRVSADPSGLNLESVGANHTIFRTNGVERARIDSSGNLGVGISNPQHKLQVIGDAFVSGRGRIGNSVIGAEYATLDQTVSWCIATLPASTDGTFDHIRIHGVMGPWTGGKFVFEVVIKNRSGLAATFTRGINTPASGVQCYTQGDGSVKVYLTIGNPYWSATTTIESILPGQLLVNPVLETPTGTLSYTTTGKSPSISVDGYNTSVAFSTGDVERARIDSSGHLLVGKTTTGANDNGSMIYPTGTIGLGHSSGTVNGTAYTAFGYDNGGIGSITQSGTTSVAYNTSSDYRLKSITGPITNSGQYIDSLNPVEGTWKADGSTFVGLIAHEAQEASRTNVATGEKDAIDDSGRPITQAMDYSSPEIIANMIAELKSLRARVAALESN